MTGPGYAAPLRPSEAWARLRGADELLVCQSLPGGAQLCALSGTRLALRLGALGPNRPPLLAGSWTGISTVLMTREHDPGQRYLVFQGQPGYERIFMHLADELHVALRAVPAAQEIPPRLLAVLQLWSGFLARARTDLDRTAAVGLYAELAFLEQIVAPQVGWRVAMALWTAPEGTPQDLSGAPLNALGEPGLLLEVKSTSPDSQAATISSIEQLDPPGGRAVWVAQALRPPVGTDTLISIRDRVLASCADEDGSWPVPARYRLLQAGLLGLEEDHTGLGVDGWRLHRTDQPQFPVLRRAALPAALIRATYVIDLGACPEEDGRLEALGHALDAEARLWAEESA